MRLRLLTFVGAMALALAVPSAALARHGHGGKHGHHHAKNRRAHHATFRFEHIGASGVSAPTTTPTAPTPTQPTATTENAGKVTSFEKEVLTITLNDNSTVSGKVTSNTRIECVSATPTAAAGVQGSGEDGSEDSGAGDDQSRGDMNQSGDSNQSGDDEGEGGEDDGVQAAATTSPEPPCDTSLLTAGREVRSAELRIGPAGAEFEDLVLVR